MIDYTKATKSLRVIELLKERERIEGLISDIDDMALIEYELLRIEDVEEDKDDYFLDSFGGGERIDDNGY